MNIHEYQAKELLEKFGVATTRGKVAWTPDEAERIARELGNASPARTGDLVVKAFQGAGFIEFQRSMQIHFGKVYVRKPKASRDRSREVYLVGKGFRPLSPDSDNFTDLSASGARRR